MSADILPSQEDTVKIFDFHKAQMDVLQDLITSIACIEVINECL